MRLSAAVPRRRVVLPHGSCCRQVPRIASAGARSLPHRSTRSPSGCATSAPTGGYATALPYRRCGSPCRVPRIASFFVPARCFYRILRRPNTQQTFPPARMVCRRLAGRFSVIRTGRSNLVGSLGRAMRSGRTRRKKTELRSGAHSDQSSVSETVSKIGNRRGRGQPQLFVICKNGFLGHLWKRKRLFR